MGIDLPPNSSENIALCEKCGAESGALATKTGPIDPVLAKLVAAWPSLGDEAKARILELVEGAAIRP